MKLDYAKLGTLELDALKEVANIGAAHAATALSGIVNKTIMIGVSRVCVVPVEQIKQIIGDRPQRGLTVHLKVLGDLSGGLMLLLPLDNAAGLAAILNGHRSDQASKDLSPADLLALKQAGSILGASYLRAIGEFTKLSFIPSIPEVGCGQIQEILQKVLSELAKRADIAFGIETEFIESSRRIEGQFLMFCEEKGLVALLQGLGLLSATKMNGR